MAGVLKHISLSYPTHVPVITGAAEALVQRRELRNRYETNRDIKTWACWFLLKSLTTSGKISSWRKQLEHLLPWLQLNERTFYRRIDELKALKLIRADVDSEDLFLITYEKAAAILDITFTGTVPLQYNHVTNAGKQAFQYLIRSEEIRSAQETQLEAIRYHLDKNPSLKSYLIHLLEKHGADKQKLYKNIQYFQEQLLRLQLISFKEGSELLSVVFTHRADINRGVKSIKKAHTYKSASSVTYMKKRMVKLGVISVAKKSVQSEKRSRLYIPDGNKDIAGYKWINASKRTALFLTDQISFLYETKPEKKARRWGAAAA